MSRRQRPHRRAQSQPARPAVKAGSDTLGGFATMYDAIALGGGRSFAAQLSAAEGYWFFARKHPWVGSAIRMISGAIATAGYEVVNPSSTMDQDEVDTDPRVPALRVLFDNPNNDQTWDDLVEEISMDLDVVGKCYVHKLRFGDALVGLERIDSRTMGPVLSDDGKKIVSFKQKVSTRGQDIVQTYNPSDIIFFKLPGGKDVLGGDSLMEQLDLTLAIDWAAKRHNASYFRNGAKAGIVLINRKMSADDKKWNEERLERQRTGSEEAYRPLVLAGEWEVSRPDTNGDEEFSKGQDRALTDVCGVYHVPESKIKTTEGALGGNGKEADDQTFHEECVLPRARRIYRRLTQAVLRDEFGITDLELRPKAKYAIRLSSIPCAVEALQGGASVNEARAIVGWPKSADANADLDRPYVANTVVAVQDPVDPLEMAEATAKIHAQYAPGQPPGNPPGKTGKAPPAKKAAARVTPGRFRTIGRSFAPSRG